MAAPTPEPDTEARGLDLVVVTLSGVQRFISESRATSDLSSTGEIVAPLASEAAIVYQNAGAEIVFPAVDPSSAAKTTTRQRLDRRLVHRKG